MPESFRSAIHTAWKTKSVIYRQCLNIVRNGMANRKQDKGRPRQFGKRVGNERLRKHMKLFSASL